MIIQPLFFLIASCPLLVIGMEQAPLAFTTSELRKERISQLKREYLLSEIPREFFFTENKRVSSAMDTNYVGPKVWDVCCSNLYINTDTFAIADQEEFSIDIFNAQSPFSKVASLKSPDMPCGLPALAKNSISQLASIANRSLILWDLVTHHQITQLPGHTDLVTSVSFDPANPTHVLSSSNDSTLRVWDTRTSECVQKLQAEGRVVAADVQPGNTGQVASIVAGSARNLVVWSLAMNAPLSSGSGESTVKYNNSGTSLLTSIAGGALLYDGTTYKLQNSLILPGNWSACGAQIMSADFTADDSSVVMSGSDYNVFICDGLLKAVDVNFDSGMMGVDVHFNENNTQILSSAFGAPYDSGPSVRIWDVTQLRKRAAAAIAAQKAWKCTLQ